VLDFDEIHIAFMHVEPQGGSSMKTVMSMCVALLLIASTATAQQMATESL
jgi:hypothetical protein